LYLLVSLLFAVIYVGADALTARRRDRVRVDLSFEAAFPPVPEAVWVCMSIYAPLLAAPFVLRSRRQLGAPATTASFLIVGAGVLFLMIPAEVGYPPLPAFGSSPTARMVRFADRLALDYNLVPLLLVALSATCIGLYVRTANAMGRVLRVGMGARDRGVDGVDAPAHLVDVASGYGLAWLALRWVYGAIERSPTEVALSS
jgi:hypothetical protein